MVKISKNSNKPKSKSKRTTKRNSFGMISYQELPKLLKEQEILSCIKSTPECSKLMESFNTLVAFLTKYDLSESLGRLTEFVFDKDFIRIHKSIKELKCISKRIDGQKDEIKEFMKCLWLYNYNILEQIINELEEPNSLINYLNVNEMIFNEFLNENDKLNISPCKIDFNKYIQNRGLKDLYKCDDIDCKFVQISDSNIKNYKKDICYNNDIQVEKNEELIKKLVLYNLSSGNIELIKNYLMETYCNLYCISNCITEINSNKVTSVVADIKHEIKDSMDLMSQESSNEAAINEAIGNIEINKQLSKFDKQAEEQLKNLEGKIDEIEKIEIEANALNERKQFELRLQQTQINKQKELQKQHTEVLQQHIDDLGQEALQNAKIMAKKMELEEKIEEQEKELEEKELQLEIEIKEFQRQQNKQKEQLEIVTTFINASSSFISSIPTFNNKSSLEELFEKFDIYYNDTLSKLSNDKFKDDITKSYNSALELKNRQLQRLNKKEEEHKQSQQREKMIIMLQRAYRKNIKAKRAKEEAKRLAEAKKIAEAKKAAAEAKKAEEEAKKAEEEAKRLAAKMKKELEPTKQEIMKYLNKIRCVLEKIKESGKNIKELNEVFYKVVLTADNNSDLYSGIDNINFVGQINKSVDIVELKEQLKQIKDHYEILRGPVRVYVKLKGGMNDKGVDIVGPDSQYDIKIDSPCKELKKINETAKYILSGKLNGIKTTGPFSRVYTGKENAEFMYKDSIQETIDNMIGSSDQIIMAYGPSGSGKTYNLIGSDKDKGVIPEVLEQLCNNKNVLEITMQSYQTYNLCSNLRSNNIKFDSFLTNVNDWDTLHKSITNNDCSYSSFNKSVLSNKLPGQNSQLFKYPFKFKQVGDEEIINGKLYEKIMSKIGDNFDKSDSYIECIWGNKLSFGQGKVTNENTTVKDKFTMFYSLVRDYFENRRDKFIKTKDTHEDNKDKNIKFIPKYDIQSILDVQDKNTEISRFISAFTNINIGPQQFMSGYEQSNAFESGVFKNERNGEFNIKNAIGNKRLNLLNNQDKNILNKLCNFIELYDKKFEFLLNERGTGYIGSEDSFENIIIKSENQENTKYLDIFRKAYLIAEHSRPTRGTPMNPDSSRSHLFFRFNITTASGSSTLTFIDLAGNEKAEENLFTMKQEGDGIMASLLAMKQVLKDKQNGNINSSSGLIVNDELKQFFSHTTVYNNCYTSNNSIYHKMKSLFTHIFEKDTTTVSLYLNLPVKFVDISKESVTNVNRCLAIADNLGLVTELLNQTKISKYIKKCEENKTQFGRTSSKKKSH